MREGRESTKLSWHVKVMHSPITYFNRASRYESLKG